MRLLLAVLFLLVPGSLLSGQSFTPHMIVFNGASEYDQADLLAASGLTPGRTYSQADLDAVTQKLGDSGLFSDIQWKTGGATLEFLLVPTPESQMRSIVFSNFVLFEPAELTASIHKRVPLFAGKVPVAGNLQQTIERALEAILKDRGITATVSSIGGPAALDYGIATPPVQVSAISIAGVDFDGTPSLAQVRARYMNADYVAGTSESAIRTNLLDAYGDLGFLDASVSNLTHGPASVTPTRIAVAMTGTATPGSLYQVSRLDLPAVAPGVTDAELAHATQLKVGGPASRILLLSTRSSLADIYLGHGYLDARVAIVPAQDAANHRIAYAFTADPGGQYHMRALLTEGLTAEQASEARAAWKIAPGAVFQGSEVAVFRRDKGRTLCGGRPANLRLQPERTSHLVDVALSCSSGPRPSAE